MRYYNIVITNPKSGTVLRPAGEPSPTSSYTSYENGQTIAGARDVEIDIPVVDFATPYGAGMVRIWGISLKEISQANNLNNMNIKVYGGMQKGLPLANPGQAGLLASGVIGQAFGNWIGTDQTLDLVMYPESGTLSDPKNISFLWKKGSNLSDGITEVLQQAFTGYKVQINISPDLKLTEDTPGYYGTMEQFAAYVYSLSQGLLNKKDYAGVRMAFKDNIITVYDGTNKTDPRQINFQDMIGQPTWIDPLQLQVKFVMRADLNVGDYIKFPQAQVTTSSSGAVPFGQGISQQSAFKGSFQIQSIRHVGRFRQPDAAAWATVVNCFATSAG